MTLRTRRLAAALAGTAIALTACGTDPDDAVSSPDQGQGIAVGEPNGSGDDFSQSTDGDSAFGDTMPAGADIPPETRANDMFGLTQEEAEFLAMEFGWSFRISRIDDMMFAVTEDYQIDRMTAELDTPADGGEPVVTKVTIELEDGPQVFTPESSS